MTTPNTRARTARLVIGLLLVAGIVAVIWYTQQQKNAAPTPPVAGVTELSLETFSSKLLANEQVLLLDIRSESDFTAEHIPDSISVPSYQLTARSNELKLFTDWDTVIVCSAECAELAQAVHDLQLSGFTKLSTLAGGFATYKDAGLSTASESNLVQADLAKILKGVSVPELSLDEFKATQKEAASKSGVFILDSRTSFEFVTGFIPGATNIPLHTIAASVQHGFIPRDKKIVVYDRVGNRAKIAVQALLDAGYKNVFNLTGGIEAWTKAKGETALPKADGSDLPQLIPVLYPEH
ncbi:MAG: rhodanese-like domain-containing protein [Candidatus Andersenbacteria bacterium]